MAYTSAGGGQIVSGAVATNTGKDGLIKTYFGAPASSGANVAIAAVAGSKIRVLAYRIQAGGTVNVKFIDTSAGPADLSMLWTFQAREHCEPSAPAGSFEFESGVGLGVSVNLSTNVAAQVHIIYVEVITP